MELEWKFIVPRLEDMRRLAVWLPSGIEALGFEVSAEDVPRRFYTTYFDTPALELFEVGLMLRARVEDGRSSLTLKGPRDDAGTESAEFSRDELSFAGNADHESLAVLSSALQAYIQWGEHVDDSCESDWETALRRWGLAPVISSITVRRLYEISVRGQRVGQLALDAVSFDSEAGKHTLLEMELEAESEEMRDHCSLLCKGILASNETLRPSLDSKYATAIKWAQSHGETAYAPPRSDVPEKWHKLVRTLADPGSAMSAIFTEIFRSPLERRRDEWRETVGGAIVELQQKGIDYGTLSANDAFVDAVQQASAIAAKTSQKEKLDALRNAIINSALPDPPEHALQQLYLSLVDQFTVWHLAVLVFLAEPAGWAKRNAEKLRSFPSGTSIASMLENVFPKIAERHGLLVAIWNDLQTRGLVRPEDPETLQLDKVLANPWTTAIGSEFASFILPPT
jgi:hypothetical protein